MTHSVGQRVCAGIYENRRAVAGVVCLAVVVGAYAMWRGRTYVPIPEMTSFSLGLNLSLTNCVGNSNVPLGVVTRIFIQEINGLARQHKLKKGDVLPLNLTKTSADMAPCTEINKTLALYKWHSHVPGCASAVTCAYEPHHAQGTKLSSLQTQNGNFWFELIAAALVKKGCIAKVVKLWEETAPPEQLPSYNLEITL